jgi:Protein of unknown function (DUF3108)
MTDIRGQNVRLYGTLKRGVAAAALLFSLTCAAAPDSVEATYEVFKSGLQVDVRESYTRDKDRYTISSIWTPVGLLAMFKPEKFISKSEGLIGKQGLQPLHFSHRREREVAKNSSAEFDWADRQLSLTSHGQRTVVILPNGTQDRLSAMYQFMFLPLHDSATLNFSMTDGNKLENYSYALTHRQKLKVPAGDFEVIYLDSQFKPGETRTEIWLATQYHNLLCKMIITEANGAQFTQVLSKLDIRP